MDIVQATEVMGNVGEFVGSFAVLATLLYLAVQVKHGRELLERQEKMSMSQVFQARAAFRIEQAKMQQSNDLAEVLAEVNFFDVELDKAVENFEGLSSAGQIKFRSFILATNQAIENSLYQQELGLLELPSETIDAALRMASFCALTNLSPPDRIKALHEQSIDR
jgi:hypothetical protein